MDILKRMTDSEIRAMRRQARTMGQHEVARLCRLEMETRRRAMPDPLGRYGENATT